jgi:hypothetical protein
MATSIRTFFTEAAEMIPEYAASLPKASAPRKARLSRDFRSLTSSIQRAAFTGEYTDASVRDMEFMLFMISKFFTEVREIGKEYIKSIPRPDGVPVERCTPALAKSPLKYMRVFPLDVAPSSVVARRIVSFLSGAPVYREGSFVNIPSGLLEVHLDSKGHPWVIVIDFHSLPAEISIEAADKIRTHTPFAQMFPSTTKRSMEAAASSRWRKKFRCLALLPGEFTVTSVRGTLDEIRKMDDGSVISLYIGATLSLASEDEFSDVLESFSGRGRPWLRFSSIIRDDSRYDDRGIMTAATLSASRGICLRVVTGGDEKKHIEFAPVVNSFVTHVYGEY